MNTNDSVNEIMRLASLLATARVRRFAVNSGQANTGESRLNVAERAKRAEDELRAFVQKALSCPPSVN